MSSRLPLIRSRIPRPTTYQSLVLRPSRSSLSTLRPLQSSSPLFNLTGLANSRESQHFSRERRIPRTEFSPQLQLLRASEVDPFAPAPGASRAAVEAAAAKTLTKAQSQAQDAGKEVGAQDARQEGAHRKKVLSDFWGNQIDSEDMGAGGRKDEGIKMATLASEIRPYARDELPASSGSASSSSSTPAPPSSSRPPPLYPSPPPTLPPPPSSSSSSRTPPSLPDSLAYLDNQLYLLSAQLHRLEHHLAEQRSRSLSFRTRFTRWLFHAAIVVMLVGVAMEIGLKYYPEQVARLFGMDVEDGQKEIVLSKDWEEGKGGNWLTALRGVQVKVKGRGGYGEAEGEVGEAMGVGVSGQGQGKDRVVEGKGEREREMARMQKPASSGWGSFWAS